MERRRLGRRSLAVRRYGLAAVRRPAQREVNTIVAVTRPIGGSHWVVPWATLVVVALRAWRGRWLAAGIIAVTWMLAVVVLFASGRA